MIFVFPVPHPLLIADLASFGGKRNGFMAWDLVAVLYAIRPDRDYFNFSEPGIIHIDRAGVTTLNEATPAKHRYLVPRAVRTE